MKDINVGRALREYFFSQSISQKEVAEKIGVQPSFINMILQEKKKIGLQTADKLCKAYGFSKMWLVSGEGEMFETKNCKEIKGSGNIVDIRDNISNQSDAQRIDRLEKQLAELQHDFFQLQNNVTSMLVKLINNGK